MDNMLAGRICWTPEYDAKTVWGGTEESRRGCQEEEWTGTFQNILPQSSDLFNGQIKHYLKIYTFYFSPNLPYITIYITTMFYLLTIL